MRSSWLAVALPVACGLLVFALAREPSRSDSSNGAIADSLIRGIDWLCRQQDPDGGWRSRTYGPMRSGVGNTALILDALSRTSPAIRDRYSGPIRRGLTFLVTNLDESGFVRAPDGTSDYPTYATALTLSALRRLDVRRWTREQGLMRDYLLAAQVVDREGAPQDDPNDGGWDHLGGLDADRTTRVETDISVTCLALEALRDDRFFSSEGRDAARRFLARCQSFDRPGDDGGFCFGPVPDDPRNKAGVDTANGNESAAAFARSYGTATADGLRGLLACGVPLDDPRVRAAAGWLEAHDEIASVPGFVDARSASSWGNGLTLYYGASLSLVMNALPPQVRKARRIELIEQLRHTQARNGSWTNAVSVMREDDPLIATALAVATLATLSQPPVSDRARDN